MSKDLFFFKALSRFKVSKLKECFHDKTFLLLLYWDGFCVFHMFQLPSFVSTPVLPFPPKIFRFEMKKKLDVKILAASNIIRRTRCSWPPSLSRAVDLCQQNHLLFSH